jgi:hypothetical protein
VFLRDEGSVEAGDTTAYDYEFVVQTIMRAPASA